MACLFVILGHTVDSGQGILNKPHLGIEPFRLGRCLRRKQAFFYFYGKNKTAKINRVIRHA